MKLRKDVTAIALVLLVQGCGILPALSQATTLTGSINRTAVSVPQQPALMQQTAQYDVRPRLRRLPPHTVYRNVYIHDNRPYFQRHPKVKAAVVGAGVGAGAGAVTGLITHRGILRGAAIGAGTGAGVGLVRSSHTMKRHPLVRDVATGSLVGLGLGAAGSRHGGTMVKATALGAAIGGGYHFLRKLF